MIMPVKSAPRYLVSKHRDYLVMSRVMEHQCHAYIDKTLTKLKLSRVLEPSATISQERWDLDLLSDITLPWDDNISCSYKSQSTTVT